MSRVFKRAAARRDLVAHYVYLAENAGGATADRFLMNAEASLIDLMEHPDMGAPVAVRAAALDGLRKWRGGDFEPCLIFYWGRRDGVSVVRVLHANQDWWHVLGVIQSSPTSK